MSPCDSESAGSEGAHSGLVWQCSLTKLYQVSRMWAMELSQPAHGGFVMQHRQCCKHYAKNRTAGCRWMHANLHLRLTCMHSLVAGRTRQQTSTYFEDACIAGVPVLLLLACSCNRQQAGLGQCQAKYNSLLSLQAKEEWKSCRPPDWPALQVKLYHRT